MQSPLPFIDLQAQKARIASQLEQAVLKVVHEGKYIMGPEVGALENALATFSGCSHVIGCASGTDALLMPLMALGVKPGDAVFVPAFTFCATAEVVALAGATPVFVDVLPDTFNMDPESLKAAIHMVQKEGQLNLAGIIGVDLFGLPADYEALEAIAYAYNMWVMVDAAQGYGSTLKGRQSVTYGQVAGTSFFPAKPLGCYGDGGAIFTNDDELAALLKSIRVHGQGAHRYDNVRLGVNGRLDTLQAAILLEKMKIYPDEIDARQKVAERYTARLKDVLQVPEVPADMTSVWAQYTLVVADDMDREAICQRLKEKSVPTMVYYPKPLHHQDAYKHFPHAPDHLPVSTRLSKKVFSLPMHPYLDDVTQDYIIQSVRESL